MLLTLIFLGASFLVIDPESVLGCPHFEGWKLISWVLWPQVLPLLVLPPLVLLLVLVLSQVRWLLVWPVNISCAERRC